MSVEKISSFKEKSKKSCEWASPHHILSPYHSETIKHVQYSWKNLKELSSNEKPFEISKDSNVTYVSHVKDSSGFWILKQHLVEKENSSDGIMFLTLSKSTTWKKLDQQKLTLPCGNIRSQNTGKYGNMYVGRHSETHDVGMVVSTDLEKWSFYTDGKEHVFDEKFELLCYEPNDFDC